MRRVPIQAMKMPKAWPVLASALNDQLGWWQMLGLGMLITYCISERMT